MAELLQQQKMLDTGGHTWYDLSMTENKDKITISIDAGLLRRVDEIARKRGESRSSVIERAVSLEVPDLEKTLDEMENPILRALASAFKQSETLMSLAARIAGRTLTPEQIDQMQATAREQIKRGKERQETKKKRTQEGGEIAANG